METWKQALWLAKFELRKSAVNIFSCWIVLSIFAFIYLTSFKNYLESNYVGFDIFFLFIFIFAPFWLRPKHFQYKKISGHVYASSTLVMQTQLPIPKIALAKSRLLIYIAYFLPYTLTAFTFYYLLDSSFRAQIDPQTYIIFVLIWICYGLYFGISLPASDAGDYMNTKTVFYYFLLTFAIIMALFLLFYLVFEYGIVAWTLMLAREWPIPTIFISVLLTTTSWKYWISHMEKSIKKLDYY